MKHINYTLKRKNVIISLFDNTEILYNQLDNIGMIERIKSVPQLGCIHVIKANYQSKYNYLMTQLYLLGIISSDKMRSKLEISTNNTLKTIQNINFTIGETLQMLVILNSIGHFDTTFVSSKAMIKLCNENEAFKNTFLRSIADETTKCIAKAAIEENDYMHFHLINALIILEHMEQTNQVKFATELLYNYLGVKTLNEKKWDYIIKVFRIIRNITFNSMDLQIANLPYAINIEEKKQMIRLLEEGLSEYNDKKPAYSLIESVTKLLGDSLYYAPDRVIVHQLTSDKIVRKILSSELKNDYYSEYFLNQSSPLHNKRLRDSKKFDRDNILKMTLPMDVGEKLYNELKSIEFVRCGYYNRGKTKKTVIASIDTSSCSAEYIALRILRCAVKHLRSIDHIQCNDTRFLLVTKFFLKYLLRANHIKIVGTLDPERCVICTKGRNNRIVHLPKNKTGQNDDIVHETEFLKNMLNVEKKDEITITVPASIRIRSAYGEKKEHEYDGIIIFPNRKEKQIVFLEAKNGRRNTKPAEQCLSDKLNDSNIFYLEEDIKKVGRDAYMYYTVPTKTE